MKYRISQCQNCRGTVVHIQYVEHGIPDCHNGHRSVAWNIEYKTVFRIKLEAPIGGKAKNSEMATCRLQVEIHQRSIPSSWTFRGRLLSRHWSGSLRNRFLGCNSMITTCCLSF
jgi:hypothetical protein